MEGRLLAIRILGVVTTTHGFAFALTEGPERLLDWGRCNVPTGVSAKSRLDRLIRQSRPLFVAGEVERNRKTVRGQAFNEELEAVCARYEIMIVCVERHLAERPGRGRRPVTNHEIAEAVAARFPTIADKLPKKRRLWDGSDDRIGVLLAAAVALAGWKLFRPSRGDISSSTEADR